MDLQDMVRTLQASAQAHGHGWTALHVAAELGRADACRELLALGLSADARATDGRRPLDLAVAGGHTDAAEVLLGHQRDLALRTARANRGSSRASAGRSRLRLLLHRLHHWARGVESPDDTSPESDP